MKKLTLPTRPPTALRVLDSATWVAFPLLASVTIVVLIFSILLPVFDDGPLYVTGSTTEAIVEHTSPSGSVIREDLSDLRSDSDRVEADGTYINFLNVEVQAQATNFGAQLTLVIASLADLALAWAALFFVRGITRSSLRGEVFTAENAIRIERLGMLAIVYPLVVWFIGRSVLNTVVDVEKLGVSGFVSTDGVDGTKLWLGVGLLLLTLARAFKWGVELQELESATI